MRANQMRLIGLLATGLGLAGCDPGKNPGTEKPQTNVAAAQESSDHLAQHAEPGATATRPAEAVDAAASPAPVTPPVLRMELSRAGLPDEGNFKCDPVLADLNGDGLIDLVAHPRLADGPLIYWGDGKGGWTAADPQTLPFGQNSCGGGVIVEDINLDSKPDIIVADHCNGIFVYLGDGAGAFEIAARELIAQKFIDPERDPELRARGNETVAAGDLNGDSHIDLLAGASDGAGFTLFLGDGTGKNWVETECGLPHVGWVNRVRLADFNKDGSLDVAASYFEGPRVWLNDGKGMFTPSHAGFPTPTIRGLHQGIAVADFNSDGRIDVAATNWVDGPELYLQDEKGAWIKAPDLYPDLKGGACGLAASDLDGDGDLDLIFSGRMPYDTGFVYGVHVLLNEDGRTFRPLLNSGLPEIGLKFTWGIAVADVNKDGRLDIAAGGGGSTPRDPKLEEPVIPAGLMFWLNRPVN